MLKAISALLPFRKDPPAPRRRLDEPPLAGLGARVIGGYHRPLPRRGSRELLSAYNASPMLRAVAGKIASAVAATDWYAVHATGDGEQELPGHPLAALMTRGVQGLSGLQVTMTEELHLLLVGESFSLIERNVAGAPVRRWPIPPQWVREVPLPGADFFSIMPPHGGEPVSVPRRDMLWIKEVDPLRPYERGSGIAGALSDEINADEAASQHIGATLRNRAIPETIVSGSEAQPLDGDTVSRLERIFADRFGGPSRAGKALFTSGPINVQPITASFHELELTNIRRFEREAIVHGFGIPPEIIGMIQNSNRATIDAAELFFARHVILPRLRFRQSAYADQVAPQYGEGVEPRFVSPVEQDREFRRSIMTARPDAFTIDEWREVAEFDPLEDGRGEVFPQSFATVYAEGHDTTGRSAYGWQSPARTPLDADDGDEPAAPIPEEELRGKAAPVRKAGADDIERAVEALSDDAFVSIIGAAYRATMVEFGQQALDLLGVGISFDLLDPRVTDFIARHAAERSRLIVGTTRERLRETLTEGVESGESTDRLVERIQETVEGAGVERAKVIARTEIVRASNAGAHEAHVQAGIEEEEWLATQDEYVRETHAAMDGQRKPMGGMFRSPSGAEGAFPGDFGEPAEDINCRCAVLPVVPEALLGERRKAAWKAFDARRIPHERILERQARAAFAGQARDAIAALRLTEGRE